MQNKMTKLSREKDDQLEDKVARSEVKMRAETARSLKDKEDKLNKTIDMNETSLSRRMKYIVIAVVILLLAVGYPLFNHYQATMQQQVDDIQAITFTMQQQNNDLRETKFTMQQQVDDLQANFQQQRNLQATAKQQNDDLQETVKQQNDDLQETVKQHNDDLQETVKQQNDDLQETVKQQNDDLQEIVKHQNDDIKDAKYTVQHQVDDLQETLQQQKYNIQATVQQHGSMILALTYYREKMDNNVGYSSSLFYTSNGYKMIFRVETNSDGEGEGSHVSVSARIVKGEYDNNLNWDVSPSNY